jgi:hypothetical protein
MPSVRRWLSLSVRPSPRHCAGAVDRWSKASAAANDHAAAPRARPDAGSCARGDTFRARVTRTSGLALAALACALVVPSPPAQAAGNTLDVRRDGGTFFVLASAELAADPRVAWDTITDYERLPEFVPGIERSRVLARDGNRLTVEQRGVFRLYFFVRPVRLRLDVRHEPFSKVLARSVPGAVDGEAATLRSFVGRYSLTVVRVGSRAGVRLDYEAQFELAEELPPVLGAVFGTALVRSSMRGQFEALLREIERRQAARPSIERSSG